jgi:hypothetical protein
MLPDKMDGSTRLSYRGTTDLRPDAVWERTSTGQDLPIADEHEASGDSAIVPRTVLENVNEFRSWYGGYDNSHITYRNAETGEIARAKLENSHMPSYENRYYAKLKGLEREIESRWDRYMTGMLTLSATGLTADDRPRAPADQMRAIADGWSTARKALHRVLDGYDWEYARIWEHHQSGYGHQHIAVFVRLDEDDDGLEDEDFGPVMESFVGATPGAGSEAHHPAGDAVSLTDGGEMDNLASYLSEYLGAFDGRSVLQRPPAEQVFRSLLWATQTRRIGFSDGAQELIRADLERQQEERRQERREETQTRPEDRGDRGDTMDDTQDTETATEDEREAESEESNWDLEHIEFVSGPRERHQTDGGNGIKMITPDAHEDAEEIDPVRDMGPPKF